MTINSATNLNDRTLINFYNKLLRDAMMKAKTDSSRSRDNKEYVIQISVIEKKKTNR